jgi:hypothetical protein
MLSPRSSLNLCTCLIWFEFETWFEFELKFLEKINRKGIRNSRKMENPISTQTSPADPAPRARPPFMTSGPRLLVPARTHALFSLSLPSGADLSALNSSACTCFLSLSHGPRSSTRTTVQPFAFAGTWVLPVRTVSLVRTARTPPWTRPRRAFSGHLCMHLTSI